MTTDEMQTLAAITASDIKNKHADVDGVFVLIVNSKSDAMGAAIASPGGDLDLMIGCVVQTLGALRHDINAGEHEIVEDPPAVDMKS